MRIRRTDRAVALTAFATFGLTACLGTYDPVIGRELDCGQTPKDLCIRVANYSMSDEADLDLEIDGAQMTVSVNGVACERIGRGPGGPKPPAARCWRVEGDVPALSYHFGNWVYERPDGTLGVAW